MPQPCVGPCGRPECKTHCQISYLAQIERERDASRRIGFTIEVIETQLPYFWEMGDGEGSWFLSRLADAVRNAGYWWPEDPRENPFRLYKKKVISRSLSRQVMERDGYRCIVCETHLNLTCDHIMPESKGGPTTLDNLQTMCASCNSSKGTRLPAAKEG